MPFVWIDGPQLPPPPTPVLIPSNAISSMVDVVANTVNVGGTLSYNTSNKGYDVIYPSYGGGGGNGTVSIGEYINVSFANFTLSTTGTLNVSYANITTANILSLNTADANIGNLYNVTIFTSTVSADPLVPLGIASKQYVDARANAANDLYSNVVNTLLGLANTSAMANVGQISTFAHYPLPNGWIQAVGQTVSRTNYANLFSTIGTRYGVGDGSTTFRLPIVYDPMENIRAITSSPPTILYAHAATLLGDGRILVIAGAGVSGITANTMFGTIANNTVTWVAGTPLPAAVFICTASLLSDGRVLVTGGHNGTTTQSTTYFGTISGTSISWSPGTALPEPRYGHTVTTLPDGRIVLIGGYNGSVVRANVTFGTISGTTIAWDIGSPIPLVRYFHATVRTSDGNILVAGGSDGTPKNEVYFGKVSTTSNLVLWMTGTPLPAARWYHTATTLSDGRILIAGGAEAVTVRPNTYIGIPSIDGAVPYGVVGYYFALNILWETGIPVPLEISRHTATLLSGNSRVLVYGGLDNTSTISSRTYIAKFPLVGIKT